jgi:hypothetical protein
VSAPVLEPGDCIHIALPIGVNPMGLAAAITAAYERLGVRVFMIDHVPNTNAPVIVGVIRGVPPEVTFNSPTEYTR